MKHGVYFLFASIAITLTSCKVYEFHPSTQQVPLFKEKNELRTHVTFRNYQAAYSITNHVALMGSYFWRNQDNGDVFGGEPAQFGRYDKKNIRQLDFELAGGYYLYKAPFHLEIFGGVGYGSLQYSRLVNDFLDTIPIVNYVNRLSSNPFKFFVQSNIGESIGPIHFALSLKLLGYQLRDLNYTMSGFNDNVGLPHDLVPRTLSNPTLVFVQPALTFRYGKETLPIKIQLQMGWSQCLNYSDFNSKNYYVRLGIFLRVPFGKEHE